MRNRIAVYRNHQLITVKEHQQDVFKRPKIHKPLDPSRNIGVAELSHKHKSEFRTVRIGMAFQDASLNAMLKTEELQYPITATLDYLISLGWSEHDKPSSTKQRVKRERPNKKVRDGRRKLPQIIQYIFDDVELAKSRLFRNNQSFQRATQTGQDSVKVPLDDGWEIEIMKNIPGGSGCGLEFLARKSDRILRIKFFNLKSYMDGDTAKELSRINVIN